MLSPGARFRTIVIVVFEIGTVSVAFTALITLFVGDELHIARERKKMEAMIQDMQDHISLCGFGRMAGPSTIPIATQPWRPGTR